MKYEVKISVTVESFNRSVFGDMDVSKKIVSVDFDEDEKNFLIDVINRSLHNFSKDEGANYGEISNLEFLVSEIKKNEK